MWRGISLANKCLLMFGGAVVLIVGIALLVPFARMNALVDEGQLELSRQMAGVWENLENDARNADGSPMPGGMSPSEFVAHAGIRARVLSMTDAAALAESDRFIARAVRELEEEPLRPDLQDASWEGTTREYRYARALRGPAPGAGPEAADIMLGVLLLERRSFSAGWMLGLNLAYLVTAGTFVLLLAVLVFYLITHFLILGPVRALRETAELVREGNLSVRSEISTGDEFEELSETFNGMMGELQRSQDQLRAINAALDLKLNELAETNVSLFESAKLKGEFLASVSHELRTPLNSIIGFTELLIEIAQAEADAGDDSTRLAKRLRFLNNIHTAGRNLLDMINGILDMAKIEAGKLELRVEPTSIREACEAIVGLIQPLADKKGIALAFEVEPDLPVVQTDAKRLQQIIFNFMSNAVKFTPGSDTQPSSPGKITVRAEKLAARGVAGAEAEDRVRISVIDTGPGIAPEDQPKIFEKFQQLQQGHTRQHAGTGLGLAICKELAALLQAELQLVSDVGRGSMFSVIVPLKLDPDRAAEIKLEGQFRAALAQRKASA